MSHGALGVEIINFYDINKIMIFWLIFSDGPQQKRDSFRWEPFRKTSLKVYWTNNFFIFFFLLVSWQITESAFWICFRWCWGPLSLALERFGVAHVHQIVSECFNVSESRSLTRCNAAENRASRKLAKPAGCFATLTGSMQTFGEKSPKEPFVLSSPQRIDDNNGNDFNYEFS